MLVSQRSQAVEVIRATARRDWQHSGSGGDKSGGGGGGGGDKEALAAQSGSVTLKPEQGHWSSWAAEP